jgi:dihydrolipoamide dehydrogenase
LPFGTLLSILNTEKLNSLQSKESMTERQYDLTVIGGGPGGYVAAIRASQLGMKVGLVERDRLGGICLNWGCVPLKALIRSAELFRSFKKSQEFGISHDGLSYDFSKIIARSRGIASRISKGVEYLMKKNNIETIYGTAKLTDKNSIEVVKNGEITEIIKSNNIILATGGRPRSIPGVAIDRKKIITSTEAMSLLGQPKSMIIVGGGAIGVEFAFFYNSFGTKVTIIEMLSSILPNEDRELTKILESSLGKSGIDIFTNTKVESVKIEHEVNVRVSDKDGEKELKADLVLMAVGVQANIEDLGLETVGVKIEHGFISVNEFGKTNIDGIYAVGDLSGPPLLAHVASNEGIVAADNIAGKAKEGIDRLNIPSCTYCQPQIASIGLTEVAAIAKGFKIKIGRFPFRPLGKAMALGETEGMVKLIFDEQSGELLGAHIIGSEATELIAELGMAKALKTTWEKLHNTMHAHPTLSEAVMEAAGQAFNVAINI